MLRTRRTGSRSSIQNECSTTSKTTLQKRIGFTNNPQWKRNISSSTPVLTQGSFAGKYGKSFQLRRMMRREERRKIEAATKEYNKNIQQYLQNDQFSDAEKVYQQMATDNVPRNVHTYNAMLTLYRKQQNTERMIAILESMKVDPTIQVDEKPYMSILQSFGEQANIRNMLSWYVHMKKCNIAITQKTFEHIFYYLAKSGKGAEHIPKLFSELKSCGASLDKDTLQLIIKTFPEEKGVNSLVEWCEQLNKQREEEEIARQKQEEALADGPAMLIDNREVDIAKYFKGKSNVMLKNLDVGDIAFHWKGEPVLTIERKTIKDLATSLEEKRYREQKMRLLHSNIDPSRIMYLIEGIANESVLPKNSMMGVMLNTMLRDNMKVYRTDDLEDTLDFLERIYNKLNDQGKELFEKDDTSLAVQYSSTIKTKKKENMTPAVCYTLQLAQIPGVSTQVAAVIAKHYGSMMQLCKAYEKIRSVEKRENLLAEITYDLKSGKTRRVGNAVSKSVYHFLNGSEIVEESPSDSKPKKQKKKTKKKKTTKKRAKKAKAT